MEKPKKPIEPQWDDFPTPTEPNGMNIDGQSLFSKLDYIAALKQYRKDMDQYEKDVEMYEQIKLIKLVKNSTEKYCLKALKISRI